MSSQRDREEFISLMAAEGVHVDVARGIMRHAATLQRLAVAACNGEPYDGRQEIRAREAIELLCANAITNRPFEPIFSDDPRGAVVKLQVPSGRTNDWGRIGIGVPTRGRL